MDKVLIVGGGLAGLSAAVTLRKNDIPFELIEQSPKLGGRAYSYHDIKLNLEIDNGQHLMLGCYEYAINYLKEINSFNNINIDHELNIPFCSDGSICELSVKKNLYPLNLLWGLFNFKLFSLTDKIISKLFFIKLKFLEPDSLKGISVYEWLKQEGFSERIIQEFWKIIVVSTLNTDIYIASAQIFSNILQQVFLKNNYNYNFLTFEKPLSKIFVEPAIEYLSDGGNNIVCNERIESVEIKDGKAVKAITNKRKITGFSYIILAVPYSKGLIEDFIEMKNFDPGISPIITIHIKLNINTLTKRYYAFVDSPLHWVFNNGTHLSIVISDASKFLEYSDEQIFNICKNELSKKLNLDEKTFAEYRIIKEKRAAYNSDSKFIKRPDSRTKINNLFLAGDWVNTKLPSTIEGAIKSGNHASQLILNLTE